MSKERGEQTTTDFERRYLAREVQAMGEGESRNIGGYGAVFNVFTDMWWYLEVVDPGAFANADTEATACLHNHLDHLVVGRTKNGTLQLSTDTTGLLYDCDVAKTNVGNDLLELVRRQDVYQSSFGFTIKKQVWEEVDRATLVGSVSDAVLDKVSYGGRVEIRRIMEVGILYDVSPVTFPAYNDTTVAKKSRDAWRAQLRASDPRGAEIAEKMRLMDYDLRLKGMRMRM